MKPTRPFILTLTCALWLAAWLFSYAPTPTAAHAGGTPILISEPAGDFLISLWSLPNPVVANEAANLIVALAAPSPELNTRAGLVVLEAEIEIVLTTAVGQETVTVRPSHAQAANKLFYEGYFEFPQEGDWVGEIVVRKGEAQGDATFAMFVEPGDGLAINWLLLGTTAVFLIGLIWFVWQSRQASATGDTEATGEK